MKTHHLVAAVVAAFVLLPLPDHVANACTEGSCLRGAQPLQLKPQAAKRKAARAGAAFKHKRRKAMRAAQRLAATEAETDTTPPPADRPAILASAVDPDAPLPVLPVRTTREAGDAAEGTVAVVSADEFNELDRAASQPSILAATIVHYLGGPAVIDSGETVVAEGESETEARQAYAAILSPQPEQPDNGPLQYVLLTFAAALAAAGALRFLFVGRWRTVFGR